MENFILLNVADFRGAYSGLVTKNPRELNFIKDDDTTKSLVFEIDRTRFDRVMRKIAYGLYFNAFKETWDRALFIGTENLVTDAYEIDPIGELIKTRKHYKTSLKYKGENPDVFRFAIVSDIQTKNKIIIMEFYEFFTVWAVPDIATTSPKYE